MPPKSKLPPAYPWAKGNGKLEPFLEGVIFGMHLLECPVPVIAARVDMHRKNVYAAIKSVNLRLGIVKADDTPANPWAEESEAEPNEVQEVPPTTPLKQVIKRRREEVGQLMTEKDDTGAYVYNSSRDISRALRGVVSRERFAVTLQSLSCGGKSSPRQPS